jgi:hypothetical protein
MTMRLVAALVLLLAGVGSAIAATSVSWKMVEQVNSRLPDNERFDSVWWAFPKYLRLFRQYRRLYPSGRLVSHFWYLQTAMLVSLVGVAWLVGFFL